jgi:hypothetical protein
MKSKNYNRISSWETRILLVNTMLFSSWVEMVTTPRELGVLRVRRLEVMNKACILKHGWKMFVGCNSFGARCFAGNTPVMLCLKTWWFSLQILVCEIILLNWDCTCLIIAFGMWDFTSWQNAWIEPGLCIDQHDLYIPVY